MGEATTRDWVRWTVDAAFGEEGGGEESAVGDLELAPFQTRAVRRGAEIAGRYGGVVIADAVGLGKTRVSLGIVERLCQRRRTQGGVSGRVLVSVPARLREQWRRRLQSAGLESYRMVSHTAMSRGAVDGLEAAPGVVLVDEAHRFRNPDANRSRALADLCVEAPVVLATATPVCNSIWDLYHLFALFVAEHDLRRVVGYDLRDAFERAEEGEFDLTELVERLVIRRATQPEEGRFGERPSAKLEILRYEARGPEAWIWQHLEERLRGLEFAAFGEDWPEELFVEYACRRWESGPEALLETLERLREFHRRWLEARRHGRRLERSEFRELFESVGDRRQEVFPFLFAEESGAGGSSDVGEARAERVRRDREVVEELHGRVEEVVERRFGPVGRIGELAESLDGRLLVFTRYRRAAEGMFETLRGRLGSRGRVALVTGERAVATGLGRCSMDEVLRRFAPRSYGETEWPAHQRIRVLVGTDCLSEGVNLQDCGKVVLSDLPYSALVVEQRIGRVVRPGSPHETVRVYLPRPRNWSDTLGLRRRLRRKLAEAEQSGAPFTAAGGALFDEAPGRDGRPTGSTGGAAGGPGFGSGRRVAERGSRRSVERGPDQMGRATSGVAPLAALTKLDALRERLGPAGEEPNSNWWRAGAPVEEPCLWLSVRRTRGEGREWKWLLVPSDGPVVHRRSRLVRALVALADADIEMRRGEPPRELLERGRRWVESRRARLRAVTLAPVPLSWDAPQYRVWRRICGRVESGALELREAELDSLRRRLLRPFPRGTARQFERLSEADVEPKRLLRAAERICERFEPVDAEVELEIRSGVHLRPRPP